MDKGSARVKISMLMKVDVYGNGNFKKEHSTMVCEMRKISGEWRLFNAKQ